MVQLLIPLGVWLLELVKMFQEPFITLVAVLVVAVQQVPPLLGVVTAVAVTLSRVQVQALEGNQEQRIQAVAEQVVLTLVVQAQVAVQAVQVLSLLDTRYKGDINGWYNN
jgi:hypothetical protein